MWETLAKLKFPALLLLVGAVILLPSLLQGLSVQNFAPAPRAPSLPGLIIGGIFVLLALVAFLLESDALPSLSRKGAVKPCKGGLTACFDRLRVNLLFGRLESAVDEGRADGDIHMVLLPTNEFYDDDCFKAPKTAAGAYLRAKFRDQEAGLRKQVDKAKAKMKPVGHFEKEREKFEASYGAGSALFIPKPIGSPHPILFAAVATKRAKTGLESNPGYIFQCIEHLAATVNDTRSTAAFLPLIGAGKGRIAPEASLMVILLSISTVQRRPGAFDVPVNIVIFQADENSTPDVSRREARRILSLASEMHAKAAEK